MFLPSATSLPRSGMLAFASLLLNTFFVQSSDFIRAMKFYRATFSTTFSVICSPCVRLSIRYYLKSDCCQGTFAFLITISTAVRTPSFKRPVFGRKGRRGGHPMRLQGRQSTH